MGHRLPAATSGLRMPSCYTTTSRDSVSQSPSSYLTSTRLEVIRREYPMGETQVSGPCPPRKEGQESNYTAISASYRECRRCLPPRLRWRTSVMRLLELAPHSGRIKAIEICALPALMLEAETPGVRRIVSFPDPEGEATSRLSPSLWWWLAVPGLPSFVDTSPTSAALVTWYSPCVCVSFLLLIRTPVIWI